MRYFKHLKIFIFIMIIFLNINVFASNTNVSNKIKYSTDSAKGTYNGDEIYLGGYNGLFSVNTRYNGRLSMVSFYLSTDDYDFKTNHTYTITLNMATEDWRNNFMGPQAINAQSNGSFSGSLSVSNFRFVSKKQIKFNFKTGSTLYPYIFFRVYSTDYASTNTTAITGVNNWNLSSIYINNNVSSTPTPAPVTPAPTPTPQPNNQDIINNANQNTQDIINNSNQNNQNLIDSNNQNTTDIIENNNNNTDIITNNANQNTDKIVDSVNDNLSNVCPNILDLSKFSPCNLSNNGDDLFNCGANIIDKNNDAGFLQFSTNGDWQGVHSDYMPVSHDTTYYLFGHNNNNIIFQNDFYCILLNIYNSEKSFLRQEQFCTTDYEFTRQITTPYNGAYMRLGISYSSSTSRTTFAEFYLSKVNNFCSFGSTTSKLDQTTDAINNVNNSINNSNIDDKTGFFSNFNNDTHGLTGIITLPLTTIQSLTNTSCVQLSIPIPFTNSNVSLPCMTQVYETYIPSVFSIWRIVSFGIISYFICIDIFKMVKGFKDPNEDKVEVLDL